MSERCGIGPAATREGVLLLEFFDRPTLPAELGRLRAFARGSLGIGRFPPLDALERELDACFAGTGCSFRTPLVRRGTPFSRTGRTRGCS